MFPERAAVLIVGGGIVGLTLARELAAAGKSEIVVLEKEPELGRHASGRNSGVLHAGIYYTPDSMRARSCLAGNRLMREYCRGKNLPLVESGKVIVARSESELPVLDELHRRGTVNGARVEFVDERQLVEIEPSARTVQKALYVRDTAVIDPRAVLRSLREDLEQSGQVRIVTDCQFLGLAGPSMAETTRGRIAFDRFVNAAGAYCDVVARAFRVGLEYQLIPFKGIYRKLRKGSSLRVNGNIYPVPDIRNPFLGVHFTRSVHGEVYLGPTAIPAFGRENYGFFSGADAEGASILLAEARLFFINPRFRQVALTEPRKYVPAFFNRDAARMVRSFDPSEFEGAEKVGIRPQLVDRRSGELVMDFVVQPRDGSVHVLNPISPAFTASMDLAKRIQRAHFA